MVVLTKIFGLVLEHLGGTKGQVVVFIRQLALNAGQLDRLDGRVGGSRERER